MTISHGRYTASWKDWIGMFSENSEIAVTEFTIMFQVIYAM